MNKKYKKYWLSPKIKFQTWKTICDKFPDSGPTPKNGDRILWELLHERKINIYIQDGNDPINITLKPIPPKAILIASPKEWKTPLQKPLKQSCGSCAKNLLAKNTAMFVISAALEI